jgi:N-acetylglutamate synthase-like GNAT family acetyltransferase
MDEAIAVRVLEPADVPIAEELLGVVYGTPSARSARRRLERAPEDWLLAERRGVPAGIVASTCYGRVAYVNMLGVAPRQRRHGVATALVETLIARLEATGVTTHVLDATESAAPLYLALGFRQIDRTDVYEDPGAPSPADDAAPEVAPGVLERVLELDARFYGCDRSGELRRFAREPYALALVEEDGYLMQRGRALGPFAAATPASAFALLRRARARRPAAYQAFAPAANPDAGALLQRFGFRLKRSLRHMERGEPSPFQRRFVYSQASLGHG